MCWPGWDLSYRDNTSLKRYRSHNDQHALFLVCIRFTIKQMYIHLTAIWQSTVNAVTDARMWLVGQRQQTSGSGDSKEYEESHE